MNQQLRKCRTKTLNMVHVRITKIERVCCAFWFRFRRWERGRQNHTIVSNGWFIPKNAPMKTMIHFMDYIKS